MAVFATGQEWQFANWPFGWKEPVQLFSRIMGFSLRYKDEPISGMLPKWKVSHLMVC